MKTSDRLRYIAKHVTAMTIEVRDACADGAREIDCLYEALDAVDSEIVLTGHTKEIVCWLMLKPTRRGYNG